MLLLLPHCVSLRLPLTRWFDLQSLQQQDQRHFGAGRGVGDQQHADGAGVSALPCYCCFHDVFFCVCCSRVDVICSLSYNQIRDISALGKARATNSTLTALE